MISKHMRAVRITGCAVVALWSISLPAAAGDASCWTPPDIVVVPTTSSSDEVDAEQPDLGAASDEQADHAARPGDASPKIIDEPYADLLEKLMALSADNPSQDSFQQRTQRLIKIRGETASDFQYRVSRITNPPGATCVPELRYHLNHAAADTVLLREVDQMLVGVSSSPLERAYGRRQTAALDEQYAHAAQRVSMLSNQYGLYVGGAFSLDALGAWVPGVEAMARFEKEATGSAGILCPGWFLWCRLFTEISYQTIGAVDKAAEAADPDAGGGLGGIGEPVSGNSDEDNPFLRKAGYLRFNMAGKFHFFDWLGIQAGAGLSSLPDSALEATHIEPRLFGGLSTMTVYSDGALSEMFVGYAHDRFWQEQSYNRYVIDGVFMIPGLRPKGFSIAVRLFMDGPIDGEGASEARASLLLYQPFSDWTRLFNPTQVLSLPDLGLPSLLQ